jgi:rSAM/selenodomain-associated transferase 2
MAATLTPTMRLAIVLPVLDEQDRLATVLAALAPLRTRGAFVVVADGGSSDASADIARALADLVIAAPRGRARQMNAGARAALDTTPADALLFLHADTQLPPNADLLIAAALAAGAAWGRFDVRIIGRSATLGVIARAMNWRSRLTGVATGDQAIFVTRAAWQQLGGYAELPLMEDVEFSRRARRLSRPACIATPVQTAGRRWDEDGVLRTVLLMWRLRAAYWLGADPAALARRYRDVR